MQKKFGAILFVAGTCIGSGMIALPMVLARLGIIPSIALMLFIWFIMYYTSLINLELNLQTGHGLSLGALGRYFSGKKAETLGTVSLKVLSYSLLAAYIYGGVSVLHELIIAHGGPEFEFKHIAILYTLSIMLLLLLPIKWIDYMNRFLFIGLLSIITILVVGLVLAINWSNLPLFTNNYSEVSSWMPIIPVVFTSFGYQVIFHTLTNYCHKNTKMLKQAFFWGSLIPAIVYILWTSSVLSITHHDNPLFYSKLMMGKVEVGELIQELSAIAEWPTIQTLVWWTSLLAILTSVLGVSVGLFDAIRGIISSSIPNKALDNIIAAVLTVLPAYLVVILVPNAFISVLGFAGMILAFIAILLPTYLLGKASMTKLHYPELRKKWLIRLSVGVSLVVIISELMGMYAR